jgi:hypothetical protein
MGCTSEGLHGASRYRRGCKPGRQKNLQDICPNGPGSDILTSKTAGGEAATFPLARREVPNPKQEKVVVISVWRRWGQKEQ